MDKGMEHSDGMTVELIAALDQPVTQEEFGLVVGITQQAVSSLCKRGVLLQGQSCREWLHRYLTHLRETALARMCGKGET